jgi:hypothetical protein
VRSQRNSLLLAAPRMSAADRKPVQFTAIPHLIKATDNHSNSGIERRDSLRHCVGVGKGINKSDGEQLPRYAKESKGTELTSFHPDLHKVIDATPPPLRKACSDTDERQ